MMWGKNYLVTIVTLAGRLIKRTFLTFGDATRYVRSFGLQNVLKVIIQPV